MTKQVKIRIRIKHVEQTCDACPSQWDLQAYTGEQYYVRYRWGCLAAYQTDIGTDDDWELLYHNQLGDGFDGTLSTSEMNDLTSDIFDYNYQQTQDEESDQS